MAPQHLKMAGNSVYLLIKHKAQIVRELDVNRVLPQLVHRGVFNYSEEREIFQQGDSKHRAEAFVDLLSCKGLNAFHEFCTVLEHSSPGILVSFLLDNPGKFLIFRLRIQLTWFMFILTISTKSV